MVTLIFNNSFCISRNKPSKSLKRINFSSTDFILNSLLYTVYRLIRVWLHIAKYHVQQSMYLNSRNSLSVLTREHRRIT